MEFNTSIIDKKIRAALKNAEQSGNLSLTALIIGIDEEKLNEIINSTGEISAVDRIAIVLLL